MNWTSYRFFNPMSSLFHRLSYLQYLREGRKSSSSIVMNTTFNRNIAYPLKLYFYVFYFYVITLDLQSITS